MKATARDAREGRASRANHEPEDLPERCDDRRFGEENGLVIGATKNVGAVSPPERENGSGAGGTCSPLLTALLPLVTFIVFWESLYRENHRRP